MLCSILYPLEVTMEKNKNSLKDRIAQIELPTGVALTKKNSATFDCPGDAGCGSDSSCVSD